MCEIGVRKRDCERRREKETTLTRKGQNYKSIDFCGERTREKE